MQWEELRPMRNEISWQAVYSHHNRWSKDGSYQNLFNFSVDHLNKENKFFDDAEANVLSKEEENEMYEQYRSVIAIVKKIEQMIAEIDWLETRQWYKN